MHNVCLVPNYEVSRTHSECLLFTHIMKLAGRWLCQWLDYDICSNVPRDDVGQIQLVAAPERILSIDLEVISTPYLNNQ